MKLTSDPRLDEESHFPLLQFAAFILNYFMRYVILLHVFLPVRGRQRQSIRWQLSSVVFDSSVGRDLSA